MKLFGKISNRKRNDSVFYQLFYRERSNNTRNNQTIFDILRTSGKLVPIDTKIFDEKDCGKSLPFVSSDDNDK